ncbi:MAG: Mobile element protein [uncultured Acetobacteraceae bacterium]|uniref:Mobile element protein n=1 Tax=uncultured Acetobacteraceae bacterium TaxID=169975 RepID=A0A6J4I725_9PROT|nr:MAG: Mobile element protein [uncultured Acetobacteraceae bacterium]
MLRTLDAVLGPERRKTGWMRAEAADGARPWRQQTVRGRGRWEADALRDTVRDHATEALEAPDAVLVADETGFLKQGKASRGVGRQCIGSASRITNCQVGVFAAYASRHGHAIIGRALYMPKDWVKDPARLAAAHVPESVAFATKPRLALGMAERAIAAGAPFAWVAADVVYGTGEVEMALRCAGVGYVFGTNGTQPYNSWIGKPGVSGTAEEIARALAPSAWRRLPAGEGTKGPRLSNWAYLELADFDADEYKDGATGVWKRGLLVRRGLADGEGAFFSTWCPAGAPIETLVSVKARVGRSRTRSRRPRPNSASTTTRPGRDPMHSSRGHFVKANGLCWFTLALLAPVPWSEWAWAVPFLTALASSGRHARGRGRRHRRLTAWVRQALLQLARWPPDRRIVAVADRSYAALELLHAVRGRVCVVARLRLDARLFDPPPPGTPRTIGRPRVVGTQRPTLAQRLHRPDTPWCRLEVGGWCGGGGHRLVEAASGTAVWHHTGLPTVPVRWVLVRDPQRRFDPQAPLCTDLSAEPADVLSWFIRRWSVEATFAEARRHLGVETQRQWSDAAVARTTPALLGLFSPVPLRTADLHARSALTHRRAAWYRKEEPTQRRARRRPALALGRSGAFPDTAAHRRPRGSAARRAGPPGRHRLPRGVPTKVEVRARF